MYNFIFGNISICGGIFIFIFLRKIKKYKKKSNNNFPGKMLPCPFQSKQTRPHGSLLSKSVWRKLGGWDNRIDWNRRSRVAERLRQFWAVRGREAKMQRAKAVLSPAVRCSLQRFGVFSHHRSFSALPNYARNDDLQEQASLFL